MSLCLSHFVSFCVILCSISYGQTVTIPTSLGQIKGTIDSKSWNPIVLYEFKGISYATAPVGNLRFRSAVLNSTKWNGVYDATQFGSICVQSGSGNENCLFLNIWTTKSNVDNIQNNQSVPVMLFIHGGSFTGGSGNPYNGTNFIGQYGELVYVSINYRLGALGWLSSQAIYNEDPNWKSYGGMNGLHDQIVALQWVKQNIQSFGGDPARVTVFGESAGALSVCMLLVSPLATNLFQRALAESGPCIGPWQTQTTATGLALSNASLTKAGYPTNNLTYLRSIDAATFNSAVFKAGGVSTSVDTLILKDLPINLYVSGNKVNAPDSVTFGFNSLDGIFIGLTPRTDAEYKRFIARWISNTTQQTEIHDVYYPASDFTPDEKDNEYQLAWLNIIGDTCVTCPTLQIGNIMVNNKMTSSVYIFDFLGSDNNGVYYAAHGTEIAYVFDIESYNSGMPWDQNLSDSLVSSWNNFGKYGKPNVTNKFEKVNINWDEFDVNNPSVMRFQGGGDGIKNVANFEQNYRKNACNFWWYEVGWYVMTYVCTDGKFQNITSI